AADSLAVEESDDLEQTDDFMIFKRGERQNTQRKKQMLPSAEGLTIEDNLQLIEREMIKLRDMFKQGHVARDVYVEALLLRQKLFAMPEMPLAYMPRGVTGIAQDFSERH
ncbi:MAG: hypothetical protein ACPGHX_08660, partial [Candidatus Puniceispirillaceae bacterium]